MNIQIIKILPKFNFDFTLIWQSIKNWSSHVPGIQRQSSFTNSLRNARFSILGNAPTYCRDGKSRIFLSCSLTERFMIQDRFNAAFVWVVCNESERWILCPWALSRSDIYKHYTLIWTWCLKLRHLHPDIPSIFAFPIAPKAKLMAVNLI